MSKKPTDHKLNTAIITRIWREHTKKYIGTLIGAIVLTALIGSMEAYSVSLLKPVFDDGFIGQDKEILTFLCVQIVAIYFLKGWLFYFHALILNHVTTKTIQAIQQRVFTRLLSMDLGFFNKNSSGQMMARIINDCNSISNIAINFITNVFKDVITCIAMFSLMIYYSWQMMISILIFVPIGAFAVKKISRKIREISQNAAQTGASQIAKISESLQSIKIIKSYNMERYEQENLKSIMQRMFNLSKQRVKATASLTPVIETLSGLIMACIIVFGGWQISEGMITTGGFVAFLGAWVSVYRPLKSLLNFRVSIQTAIISAERVYQVIDTESEIVDMPGAKQLTAVKGEIAFENVSFEYEEGIKVLNKININIKAGQNIALVGASGGGKTTLLSLVPRFYDATGGSVKIDGNDIKTVTQQSLRKYISYVSQDVILFDDTIANNIAYGMGENAQPTIEEIRAAATNANADHFIMKMSDGYETMIGEKGVRLSGGQKQRVSIARAMIKNAPILLLDEATSALDAESEREVQAALDILMKDRTTIVIAHRLSTIVNADKIYVIANGVVIEEGTHNQLLAKNGEYEKLYNMQFKSIHAEEDTE